MYYFYMFCRVFKYMAAHLKKFHGTLCVAEHELENTDLVWQKKWYFKSLLLFLNCSLLDKSTFYNAFIKL